jgi:hypothetical protein
VTASPGSWTGTTPITYTYQWYEDGAPLNGATGTTFTIGPAYGRALEVAVTASNDAGSPTAYSQAMTIPYPPGTPSSVVATVSGPSTVIIPPSNVVQACVDVHLSNGSDGTPVQASYVDLNITISITGGPTHIGDASGSTDPSGNVTICYSTSPADTLTWSADYVQAGPATYTGAGALTLTSNSFSQQLVFPCPPACGGQTTGSGGASASGGTQSSPTPASSSSSTTGATASPVPTTTTAPENSPTGNGSSETPSPRLTTVNIARPAPVELDHPSMTLMIRASRAAVASLTLFDAKGLTVSRWTARVRAGSHKLSLELPSKARHPGRDTLRLAGAGVKPQTVSVRLTA